MDFNGKECPASVYKKKNAKKNINSVGTG